MSSKRKVVAVVGVGKGIGGSVAIKFAKEGFDVAILARNQTYSGANKLTPLQSSIESLGMSLPLLLILSLLLF
jgi:NAD(P)-dependent dehydrogenase (short-subunit alcohol dehydrogenase family)